MASMARGRAASELAVANAIDAGSAMVRKNRRTLRRAISATGINTQTTRIMRAAYKVSTSLARFHITSKPMVLTVTAIAPATPMGANSMTILVNLNMTSEKL